MTNKKAIHVFSITSDDFANIAHVENDKGDTDQWDEQQLVHKFSNTAVLGFKAEIDGNLAGYVIYEHDEIHHQNSVLKLVVAPEFQNESEAAWNALLNHVKQDMSYEGRHNIVVYISATEEKLVQFLKKPELGYKILRGAGTDHIMAIYEMPKREQIAGTTQTSIEPNLVSNPNMFGGQIDTNAFVSVPPLEGFNLNQTPPADLYGLTNSDLNNFFGSYTISSNSAMPQFNDGYQSQEGEYQITNDEPIAPTKFQRLSPRELMIGAREKITALTNMEWETVLLDKRGKMKPIKINNDTNPSETYLRTASKVKNPAKALAAISEFLGEKPPKFTSKLSQPAQVAIPISWFRQIHLSLGDAGKLSDDFVPASTHLRYEPSSEIYDPAASKSAER